MFTGSAECGPKLGCGRRVRRARGWSGIRERSSGAGGVDSGRVEVACPAGLNLLAATLGSQVLVVLQLRDILRGQLQLHMHLVCTKSQVNGQR